MAIFKRFKLRKGRRYPIQSDRDGRTLEPDALSCLMRGKARLWQLRN